jgi:hypothetical protein
MTVKLYELSDAYRALQETEELTEEELNIALTNIEGLFNEKALSIGRLINEEKAEVEAVKIELERLTARKNTIERRIDGMKNYLTIEMSNAGIDKVKDAVLSISLQKNKPSVKVYDEENVPDKFFREIPAHYEVDKIAILEAYKGMDSTDWFSETIPIPGVEIITDKKHVVIR